MRKRFFALGMAGMLMFCGCGGNFPVMTDEESELVGEYAAVTLLKYDANQRSRLVDLSWTDSKTDAEDPVNEQEPEKEPAVPETPVIEPEEPEGVGSLEEYFGLAEGMAITFAGVETGQSYSNGANDYFSIDAAAGKSLLALNFQISNMSGAEQTVNLLDRKDIYRVTVNGSHTRTALRTMLLNDMTTYMDAIAPGDSVTVVVVVEIDANQADAISSIELNLKNESSAYTIQLV